MTFMTFHPEYMGKELEKHNLYMIIHGGLQFIAGKIVIVEFPASHV